MSRLVIDSCVAIKWFINESGSSEARSILSAYLDDRLQVLAPDLIHAEIGNVLWTQCHRTLITADVAWEALAALRRIQFSLTTAADLLNDAMRLALGHGQSIYDCLYIALCQRENCPLVTADEKLVRKFAGALSGVTVLRVAEAVASL